MPGGRPREFDRDKALEDAMLLFWRKGYHSTSLRDVAEALGVQMPSIYAAFGSKDRLYAEAMDLYMKVSQSLLWGYLERAQSARSGLRDLLIATAKELTNKRTHPNGCLVTLATVDEDMPKAAVEAIHTARKKWLDVIRAQIDRAIKSGELPASADSKTMSRFFTGIVQTIGIQARDGAKASELVAMVDIAMAAWPLRTPKTA